MSLNEKRKLATSKKSILNWLEEQSKEEKELSIVWDGGGDSGWVYFEIDGDTVENEYTETLVDYMYQHLDYGSWAGEFQAQGTAVYNPETKCFEGTDYYSEDSHDCITDLNIKIVIPKSFWFDSFHVECECNYDEEPSLATRFIVKNGFLITQHEDFCRNLDTRLTNEFAEIFNQYQNANGDNFRGCNDSWIFNRSEAVEEGDNLVFTITAMEVQTVNSEDKNVTIEITDEMVKEINEKLNENA